MSTGGASIYQGPATLQCSDQAGAHRWGLRISTDLEQARALGRARTEQDDGLRPLVAVEGAGEGRVEIAAGPIGGYLAIRLLGQAACPLLEHR